MASAKLLILVLPKDQSKLAALYRERFKDVNVGSPIYMPPEALLQSVYNPKTDIWAYGILIYELLHGDPPLAFCQA